ncbi:MAG: hypothetical protein ISS25_04985 [Nanoarchaeota archaeon]|nr:hypothetical protein [DPANN group archaeon]MBL7117154.1 hypothetical protein [Nanoarchaeota archaeon]
MGLVEQLSQLDGLVLVNLDIRKLSGPSLSELTFASCFANQINIPVVAIPHVSEEKIRSQYGDDLSSMWTVVSPEHYDDPRPVLDHIAENTRVPADGLILGFGGIGYRNGVASLARRSCCRYVGPTRGTGYDDSFLLIRAYKGIVLRDICF